MRFPPLAHTGSSAAISEKRTREKAGPASVPAQHRADGRCSKCRKSRVMVNIAIVGSFGYSNPHGLKSRDWKRPLTEATIRIIYIMEPKFRSRGAAGRTLCSNVQLKFDISQLCYEATK
jgi:hypothetical protein